MTDFRALCADLLDEVVARPLLLDRELIARARNDPPRVRRSHRGLCGGVPA